MGPRLHALFDVAHEVPASRTAQPRPRLLVRRFKCNLGIREEPMEELIEENERTPTSTGKKARVNRKREGGYLLIELLIALTVLAILAAMAAPSIIGLQMAANNSYAWNTVSSVYFTGKALAVCNSYQNSCPQLVMPSNGSWQQAGYTFTFQSSGFNNDYTWSFTATPIVYGTTGIHSYSASPTGITQTN